jgi:ketosteroid isomerase-like protein
MSALRHNGEIAREYLRAIEAGETGENLARFFDPEVMLEEFPNRLSPQGRRSGLAQALEAAERGQKLLAGQSYEIHSVTENGERLALEVTWIGTLKIPVENLPAGSQMRARFAVFLEFRNARIVAQRNYDCFDPW